MKPGRVVGEIWASRRVADLAGRSLKLIVTPASEPAHPESVEHGVHAQPHGDAGLDVPSLAWESLTVAIDTLDARLGQDVLVAYGSGARNVLASGPNNRHVLCDAAVALLLDSSPSDLALTDEGGRVSRPSSGSQAKAG